MDIALQAPLCIGALSVKLACFSTRQETETKRGRAQARLIASAPPLPLGDTITLPTTPTPRRPLQALEDRQVVGRIVSTFSPAHL